MWTQQVLVSVLCLSLAVQQIDAVVNTGANAKDSNSANSEVNPEKAKETSAELSDSIAASSEQEADKREAVIDLTGVYGTPLDTYLSSTTVNLDLPIPVYGVPNIGPNVIYPAPPPDIPPPLPAQYGVPNGLNLPLKEIYGPSKFSYGPPKYKPPKIKYGPPHHRPSHHSKPIYGPPRKPYFPKPVYVPPKPHYGPPKPQYGPPKILTSKPVYIPTVPEAPILSPPQITYGPPNINLNLQPIKHYGPPEPVPHSPPPGVPAPPTPPDIKYDGWQPILGLVSNPPQGTYGPPQHGHSNDLNINADFTPPQEGTFGIDSLGLQEHYKANGVVSDSYGAPLNTVTGSGGVVQISGEAHHQQGHQENFNVHQHGHQENFNVHQQGHQDNFNVHQDNYNAHQQGHQNNYNQGSSSYHEGSSSYQQGSSSHHHDLNLGLSAIGLGGGNSLSVVKSVGYELQPSSGVNSYASGFDSYSSPPSNSYSFDGSYPPPKGNKFIHTQLSSHGFDDVNAAFGTHHFSKDIGLIPPSGVYGVTPSSQYGTPLFQPTNHFKGGPKRPVVFRDPVPLGLIQTGASESARYQAHGVNTIQNAAYISPPVHEVTKPVREEVNEPSDLYSLPHIDRPISFQKVVHGSSSAGLSNEINFNVLDAHQSSFGGGGAYALPLQSNHQGSGYDLNTVGYTNNFGYQRDCNSHGSQPLPQFTYGVPSANTYTSALSSLKTNIGNTYGSSDLSGSHSVKVTSSNSISEAAKEVYAKSFGASLATGGELIKSQSIDLNNIPLQGSLGSYTLQIQPADGLGVEPSASSGVPHEQVLNDGLLQSILAAIEQPQQRNVDVNNNVPLAYSYDEANSRSDEDSEASLKNSVIVLPENDKEDKVSDEKIGKDNEVAIYFKNSNADEKKNESPSFKAVNASYKYNLKSSAKDEMPEKEKS